MRTELTFNFQEMKNVKVVPQPETKLESTLVETLDE